MILAAGGDALRPEAGYQVIPAHYGIVCDLVTFESSDGLNLSGWFFPAQDTAGVSLELVGRLISVPPELRPAGRPYSTIDDSPRPTIVICDGDAGNMSYLIFYACQFVFDGFNVLTFDWRGFGESDPWPVDADLLVCPEYLLDYDAAIDYALSRRETDPERLALIGFSTGAYLSFAMAAERSEVGALAVRAIPTCFDDLLPILGRLDPERGFRAPEGYPPELLPVNAASGIAIPVLLIVGENDERTPPWMSRQIYDSLSGPRQLWVVPGAGHGGGSAPELVAYPEFFERIRAFFDTYLVVPAMDSG
jgi:pimeloyl-ACP methyl ester carboxylesterase